MSVKPFPGHTLRPRQYPGSAPPCKAGAFAGIFPADLPAAGVARTLMAALGMGSVQACADAASLCATPPFATAALGRGGTHACTGAAGLPPIPSVPPCTGAESLSLALLSALPAALPPAAALADARNFRLRGCPFFCSATSPAARALHSFSFSFGTDAASSAQPASLQPPVAPASLHFALESARSASMGDGQTSPGVPVLCSTSRAFRLQKTGRHLHTHAMNARKQNSTEVALQPSIAYRTR